MNRYIKWAEREYGLRQRVIATLAAGIIFVILIPWIIIKGSTAIDQWLQISRLQFGVLNYLTGGLMVLVGWLFAIWSIIAQLTHGRGTPLPFMATQALLTSGPFAYCRNPMSLGTMVLYFGIAVWTGSLSAVVIVITISVFLVVILKYFEETELEERFGQTYLEYKARTPFLLPSFRKHSNGEE